MDEWNHIFTTHHCHTHIQDDTSIGFSQKLNKSSTNMNRVLFTCFFVPVVIVPTKRPLEHSLLWLTTLWVCFSPSLAGFKLGSLSSQHSNSFLSDWRISWFSIWYDIIQEETSSIMGISFPSLFVPVGNSLGSYEIIYQWGYQTTLLPVGTNKSTLTIWLNKSQMP